MRFLPAIAVFLLMLSTGMSLNRGRFVEHWKHLKPGLWMRLIAMTFFIPPAAVLCLGPLLHLDGAETAALFLISIAPGAPLMTRNAARKGFDPEVAAFYQVWGSLLAPLAIPLLVGGAAWLYGREIWIPPTEVASVMAEKQLLPLLAGMVLARLAPDLSIKLRQPLNLTGNSVLTVVLAALLWKLGPELASVNAGLVIAVIALAVVCLLSARFMIPSLPTLTVSNVNRHVGLALLLSGRHVRNPTLAIPTLACYAIAAPLLMAGFARWARRSSP